MTILQWAVCGFVCDFVIHRIERIVSPRKEWEWWAHVLYGSLTAMVSGAAFAMFGYLWNL